MSFFTVSTTEDTIKDSGNSKFINASGMYEVIIKNVIVSVNDKGSQTIDLYIDYNGQPQMIYRAMRLTDNNGNPIFGANLFTKMAVVLGAGDGEEIADPVSVMLPIGKGGESKECMVLEQFNDQPVIMRIQMEYSMWEGKINENKNIKNFFDVTSHASASEIVNNSEDKGAQYEKELEYADSISYKNDLTPEDIEAWKKNGRGTKKTEEAKKPTSFGQRRTFGKK